MYSYMLYIYIHKYIYLQVHIHLRIYTVYTFKICIFTSVYTMFVCICFSHECLVVISIFVDPVDLVASGSFAMPGSVIEDEARSKCPAHSEIVDVQH